MSRSWYSVSNPLHGWSATVRNRSGCSDWTGIAANSSQGGSRSRWSFQATTATDWEMEGSTDGERSAGTLPGDEDPLVRRRRVEAVLLLSKGPLAPRKLAQMAGLSDATEARTMIRQLNETYRMLSRAIQIELIAGGYRMMTRTAIAPWISRLSHVPKPVRLSTPMMETLAIVAYRGPVSRAAVEAVRGVACGELLRQLMERDLIRIAGRSEELGRPYLYDTTKHFLQLFGLPNTDALPKIHWEALQEDLPESTPSEQIHPLDPSTTTKEPVVTNTCVPPFTEIEPTVFAETATTEAVKPPSVDPTNSVDPTAVIQDEEDDLYENIGQEDQDEEDDDPWDDEDDWDDGEEDDADDETEKGDSDEDPEDEDSEDDLEEEDWEEVDDSDEDSADEDSGDDADEDDADESEDWDEEDEDWVDEDEETDGEEEDAAEDDED